MSGSGAVNTRKKAREMWRSYAHSRKMKAYHEEVLTEEQRQAALRSGTYSDEQRAALEAFERKQSCTPE